MSVWSSIKRGIFGSDSDQKEILKINPEFNKFKDRER